MNFEAKLPDESVNFSNEHPLIEVLKVGGTLFAMVITLYFILGWSVDFLVDHISPPFEQKMGRLITKEIPEELNASRLNTFLQTLDGCTNLPYKPHIVLSASKEVNAYALPGATIVINKGLLDQSHSENELLFVIGHELGHIKNRDHLRGMGRALFGVSLSAFLGLSETPNIFGTGMQFGESRFSQQQEQLADLYGLEFLQCHYGHVGGATDFFEHHKESDLTKWLVFSTHPQREKRIAHLEKKIAERKYTRQKTLPLNP